MANRPTEGYIPPNLSETGGMMGGMLKTRNVIEAGVVLVIAILIGKFLGLFLPAGIATGVAAVIAILFGVLAIIGVRGEPVSIFVLNIFNYRRTSGYIPIQMPMPAEFAKKNTTPNNKKGGQASKMEEVLANFLNGNSK